MQVKAKNLEIDLLEYIPRVGEEVLVRGRVTGARVNLEVPNKQRLIVKFEDGTEAWAPLDSVYEVEEWTTTKD